MNDSVIKQNGNMGSSHFDDDFVAKTNSQVRNRSFKPPSPLSPVKLDDNKIESSSTNGRITNYVNEVFNRRESLKSNRSRRASTPPFSSDFDEIECSTNKLR